MKFKNLAALFIAAAMSLTLFSCGKGETEETDAAETTAQTEAALYDSDSAAMKTENLSVTKGELTYIAYYNYQQFCKNYYEYLSYYGLDTSSSLKEQECCFDEYDTWYDYFLGYSMSYASQTLSACEAATAAGYSLSEDEMAEIDNALAKWQTAAENAGCTDADDYISTKLGCDFTLADVRSYTEKSYLSSKYFSDVIASYEFTDDEIYALYESDEDSFNYVDYLAYSFYDDNGEDGEAAAHAAALAQCTTETEFTDYVKTYVSEVILSSLSDEEKPERLETIMDAVVNERMHKADGEFYEWAFTKTDDEMPDEVGSGLIYTISDGDSGSYTVCLLTRAPYRVDTPVCTYRDIKLTKDTCETYSGAVNKAEELLASFDGTEDAFAALAIEWSEDTDSKSSGGLKENVAVGDATPDEVDAWLFSNGRECGDSAVVTADGECHLVYYVSEGLPKWQYDVLEQLRYTKYTDDAAAISASYPVTILDEVISDIVM